MSGSLKAAKEFRLKQRQTQFIPCHLLLWTTPFIIFTKVFIIPCNQNISFHKTSYVLQNSSLISFLWVYMRQGGQIFFNWITYTFKYKVSLSIYSANQFLLPPPPPKKSIIFPLSTNEWFCIYFWLFVSISDCLFLLLMVCFFFWLFVPISDGLFLFLIVWFYFWSFGSISDCLFLFLIVWFYFWLFISISDCLVLFLIVCFYFWLFISITDCLV